MSASSFESLLGTYHGTVYFLYARATPSLNDPVEFAVTVYFSDPGTQSNVEIARIDTEHGYTHFDRLYRRDEPKEPMDVGFWEAVEHLEDNWRTYAESFEGRG